MVAVSAPAAVGVVGPLSEGDEMQLRKPPANCRESWARIPGRCAYLWIYDEWLASNPRKGAIAVECGVALGKSVAYLANRCLELGRDDIQIYAVDPWAGTDRNGEQAAMGDAVGGDFTLYAKYMLENAPEAFEMVRPLRMGSIEASFLFDPKGTTEYDYKGVDVVCLDGPHDEDFVYKEILTWRRSLNPGGFLGGDDHHPEFPGVERAVKAHFANEYEYRDDNEWRWGTWRVRIP